MTISPVSFLLLCNLLADIVLGINQVNRPTWNDYRRTNLASTGSNAYNAWLKWQGDDAPFPSELRTKMTTKLAPASPGPWIAEVMPDWGVNPKGKFESFSSRFPANAPTSDAGDREWSAVTGCQISVGQGALVVERDVRYDLSDDHDGKHVPEFPYKLAQVAWWMWVSAVQRREYGWPLPLWRWAKKKELDYSGLTTIWFDFIPYPGMVDLLDAILRHWGQGKTDTMTFRPDNADLVTNPFWTLLGTQAGINVVQLLTDNKRAMNSKGIASITITIRRGVRARLDECDMWFVLGSSEKGVGPSN